ncbi:MAG TPA: peptidase E [Puia sp.]|jgi:peptidase E
MKKIFLLLMVALTGTGLLQAQTTRTIFITGGDFSTPFLKYVISLTKKSHPKICFIPTASADNPYSINWFYSQCAELPITPFILRTFLNSSPEQKTFEETLLDMDAIIVGGGSTLNMMAIWKAQGIDTILREAYDKGIVLGGGSAGSLCWFTGGFTDSRPQKLSLVECLGFIRYSHCPHYHSEPTRKPLYQEAILTGKLLPGYACDDKAGILFENEKYIKSVAADKESHTWFLSVAEGKIREELLPGEIIR